MNTTGKKGCPLQYNMFRGRLVSMKFNAYYEYTLTFESLFLLLIPLILILSTRPPVILLVRSVCVCLFYSHVELFYLIFITIFAGFCSIFRAGNCTERDKMAWSRERVGDQLTAISWTAGQQKPMISLRPQGNVDECKHAAKYVYHTNVNNEMNKTVWSEWGKRAFAYISMEKSELQTAVIYRHQKLTYTWCTGSTLKTGRDLFYGLFVLLLFSHDCRKQCRALENVMIHWDMYRLQVRFKSRKKCRPNCYTLKSSVVFSRSLCHRIFYHVSIEGWFYSKPLPICLIQTFPYFLLHFMMKMYHNIRLLIFNVCYVPA